jgi:4-amino-4-deoxy-L-arabinose transferase-like glycosyltransferase
MDNSPQPAASQRSMRIVLAVAFLLRILVLLNIIFRYPPGWLYTRGNEMGFLAKSLLIGQGLSSPFGVPTGPTAFIAPAYPILVAGIFKIFGIESVTSAVVIMLAQTAAALVTIWLMMRICHKLFNQRTAMIAGLIWACAAPLLFIPTIFWDTSFAICALTGLFALVLELRPAPSRLAWLGLGAFAGIIALLTSALVFVVSALLAWLAVQAPRGARARCLLAIFTFAIVFAPWPIRNARVFHAFIPLRTTVGEELWMGNHPNSTGFLDESLFPTYNAAELTQYRQMGELSYTRNKSALAMNYVRQNPGAFVALSIRRVIRFWTGTGTQNGSPLFAIYATFTTLFGLMGLWLVIRARRYAIATCFAIPFLLFPLPYYITHAEFRYRLLIDPLLTILAAYAFTTFSAKPESATEVSEPVTNG